MIGIKKIGMLGLLVLTFGANIYRGRAATFVSMPITLSRPKAVEGSEKTGVDTKYIATNNNYIEVEIVNNSIDSIYLFSSYFDNNLYKSKFLHRYSQLGQCILSFLPLPFYMAFDRADKMILTEQAIISQFQVPYKFELIAPRCAISIYLPADCFDGSYVKDYNLQAMHKMVRPTFEPVEHISECTDRQVMFAIYTGVDWLTRDNFYYNEQFFDTQSKLYDVILVEIGK